MTPRPAKFKRKRRRVAAPENFKLTMYEPPETDISSTIEDYLDWEPRVAEHWRVNRGTMFRAGRPIEFNTAKGHSDRAGYLTCGIALYIEVKRPGEPLTDDQDKFLTKAKRNGCCAGRAESVEQAKAIIDAWHQARTTK